MKPLTISGARNAQLREWCDGSHSLAPTSALELWVEVEALRAALAAAIGIGPGSNDGPLSHCTDCGRRMVWQYPVNVEAGQPGAPVWMCPNCTMTKLRCALVQVDDLDVSWLPDDDGWLLDLDQSYSSAVLDFVNGVVLNGKPRAMAAALIREIEQALAERRAELE